MFEIPRAEFDIDKALIKRLLADQYTAGIDLDINYLASGWDNELYRLGEDLIIRIPRRKMGADLMKVELKWLPQISEELPIPISAPIYAGTPTSYYPWSWSVVPWYEGSSGLNACLEKGEARRLAEFLKALHHPAPKEAPSSKLRGVPISHRREETEERLSNLQSRGFPIHKKHWRLWNTALETPVPKVRRWMHGDLHPNNMVVKDGRIQAVVDWGDLNAGDPATDLICLWMLFDDPAEHQSFLETYRPDADMFMRSLGWALFYASAFLENELYAKLARKTLQNLEKFT